MQNLVASDALWHCLQGFPCNAMRRRRPRATSATQLLLPILCFLHFMYPVDPDCLPMFR
ncbi:hypothetical protein HanPI659440_Chr13g0495021 [Helianthus annuus]|nr:hypothetical protein HanPI659440_Chr13g0495021 [Helianthus annuus]